MISLFASPSITDSPFLRHVSTLSCLISMPCPDTFFSFSNKCKSWPSAQPMSKILELFFTIFDIT